jgi:hypothetical protein
VSVEIDLQKKADRLDTILLTATNLCQQLSLLQKMQSQENSLLAQHGEILAAQAKEIEGSLRLFKEQVTSSIIDATDKSFSGLPDRINVTLDRLFEKVIEARFNPFFEQQSKIINESKAIIQNFHKDRYSRFLWKFLGIAIIVATLVGSFVGVLVVKQILPNNMVELTSSQVNSLSLGQKMQSIWPKLTLSEKEHMQKLFRENYS